jgi:hypothetical protein
MKISLSEFIEDINSRKKSGLLSITVKGANTLLKMFFRQGEIYHLTYGDCRGSGCLEHAIGVELAEYFFMPDVSLNIQDPDLPPLSAIIELFRSQGTVMETAHGQGAMERPSTGGKIIDASSVQERLKMALVRQIGPAGAKVMSRIVGQKWHAPASPGREDYLRLVDLLKNEIENALDQNEFLKEAKAIIS